MADDPDNGTEDLVLASEGDVLMVQRRAAHWSKLAGLSTFRATRLITAASDLARNTVLHGHGGMMRIELRPDLLRMVFIDHGPGIASLEDAMRNGFSTQGGLGLGLPGARRLVDEFALDSAPGAGTTVSIVMRRR
jgi:serine/threonine-protein kinase RsbT